MAADSTAQVVLTTVDNQADGERLATLLVERGLAACVQILPGITSIYRWKGVTERASESLLLIKTMAESYHLVEAAIQDNHPYQTPEIIALPVEAGSKDYFDWLVASVRRS